LYNKVFYVTLNSCVCETIPHVCESRVLSNKKGQGSRLG